MVGVYDEVKASCPKCRKITMHESGWESEEPNVLDLWCKECGAHRRIYT